VIKQSVICLLTAALFTFKLLPICAAEPIVTIPVGQIKDFAVAKDASTLSQNYPNYREIVGGNPVYIVPKPISIGDGFATVYAESQQTRLNVPLGWLVMETLAGAYCMVPDQSVQVVLHSEGDRSFAELRKNALSEMKGKAPQSNITVKQFDTDGGGFAIETHGFSWHGKKMSMLRVFTPHPHQPNQFKFVSLQCPEGQLQNFEPLLGAMLKSRSIDWDFKETSKVYSKAGSEADECEPIARKTAAALISGDSKAFASLISPKMLAAMGGPTGFKTRFDTQADFMKGSVMPPVSSNMQSYANPAGQKGFAFTYVFQTTSGKNKQLDLVVVKDNGKLLVSGLSLGSIELH
jgi:hypothetical protein